VYGASALDITPTILAMLGLPVGAGMDGRVLRQIFDEPPTVRPSQDQAQALDMAVREADYNLAQVYPGSARPALALPLLEKLTAEAPDTRRFELPLLLRSRAPRRRLAVARSTAGSRTGAGARRAGRSD
jgi:hypothetical protein